jgi:hypothetical protein
VPDVPSITILNAIAVNAQVERGEVAYDNDLAPEPILIIQAIYVDSDEPCDEGHPRAPHFINLGLTWDQALTVCESLSAMLFDTDNEKGDTNAD